MISKFIVVVLSKTFLYYYLEKPTHNHTYTHWLKTKKRASWIFGSSADFLFLYFIYHNFHWYSFCVFVIITSLGAIPLGLASSVLNLFIIFSFKFENVVFFLSMCIETLLTNYKECTFPTEVENETDKLTLRLGWRLLLVEPVSL